MAKIDKEYNDAMADCEKRSSAEVIPCKAVVNLVFAKATTAAHAWYYGRWVAITAVLAADLVACDYKYPCHDMKPGDPY